MRVIFHSFFRDRLNVVDNELTLFRETQTNLTDSVREAQRRLYTNEGLVNSTTCKALENEYVYTFLQIFLLFDVLFTVKIAQSYSG